jgi:hypothetical protein
MDKKEINSPKLTVHFVIWMCVGCLLLLGFFRSLRLEGFLRQRIYAITMLS